MTTKLFKIALSTGFLNKTCQLFKSFYQIRRYFVFILNIIISCFYLEFRSMIYSRAVSQIAELLCVPVSSTISREFCCIIFLETFIGRNNAWRACLGKAVRQQYLLRYPVTVIRPNGSTIEMKAAEPRQVGE